MNNRISSVITLHDALHRFRQGRETGTAPIEAKLVQQLTGLVHKLLFQVLLDLQKSYDYLDRGTYMDILRGCGLGPNLHRLIQRYW